MLSEISQTKTNTVGFHLYVESKIVKPIKQRIEWWLQGTGVKVEVLVKG